LAHRGQTPSGLDQHVDTYDQQIKTLSEQSDICRRLMTIPGVGPMVATALAASVADGKAFKNGREMAAWLGLVARQHSTGGKPRLLGISKRGDVYLRKLLIHGARSSLRWADKKHDKRSMWATSLKERRGQNIAAVALANKIVRTAWVLITRGEEYRTTAASV
jgi:transposase